jgi:[acyl-carrier-protein] S-malonyltransferase
MNGLVFMFPGQGSQKVGMGRALHDSFEPVRRLFEEACDVLGRDVRRLCFEGPEAELTATENAQPAITLVSLACFRVLEDEGVRPSVVAGHSVGEYAALCAAGALSLADALRAVQIRANAMKAAALAHPGGMAAVFGLTAEQLSAICEEAGGGTVQVANHNTPTQIVVTGSSEGLQAVGKAAKASGAKLVVPLKVSGPWHSRYMSVAQETVRDALASIEVRAPQTETIANVTAQPYPADADSVRSLLVQQIVNPVRWSDSIASLAARPLSTFIEVGPGRVLTGLLRDIARGVTSANVEDPDSLAKLRSTLAPPSA